jgi:hypothetical protein
MKIVTALETPDANTPVESRTGDINPTLGEMTDRATEGKM